MVDSSITPNSGQVVITMLDGELTVKRFLNEGGKVLLQPENPDYPTIVVSPNQDFSVMGTVIFVVHKF